MTGRFSRRLVQRLLVAVLLALSAVATDVTAATKAERAQAADQLIQEALHREIYGLNLERRQLLNEAIRQQPDHESAHWHSGKVWLNHQWVAVRNVPAMLQRDRRLEAYRRQRDKQPDTVEGQLELANWCQGKGLLDQERAHLARVIQLQPDHAPARTRLGFQNIAGVWISQQEIQQSVERGMAARANLAKWTSRLEKIRDGLADAAPARRQAAVDRLQAIDDPAAVPGLELIVAPTGAGAGGLVVQTLNQLPQRDATLALARLAVFAPWSEVRVAAAKALQSRSEEDYVPALLSTLFTPIQAHAEMYTGPGGRLMYRHAFVREGQAANELMVFETAYRRQSRVGGSRGDSLARALVDVNATAQQRDFTAAQQNEFIRQVNDRVDAALRIATGENPLPNPESWWEWWNEHNEVFVDNTDKAVRYVVHREEIRVEDRVTGPTGPGESGGGTGGGSMPLDCLAAGTLVWTHEGPVAIEDVKIGDLVLAQHPETGELAYKPVLRTTERPASVLVNIQADDQSLQTSGGHLFWVSGEGWVRARNLQSGTELHGVHGTVRVSRVSSGRFAPTYNLIVADFHTYFAGRDGRILCHDNTVRRPTTAIVPGLPEF